MLNVPLMAFGSGEDDAEQADLVQEVFTHAWQRIGQLNDGRALRAGYRLRSVLIEGKQDRDKYLAIGESDRMTLKFVKPVR
jgi:predicted methyltransferase